jgi:drug/metabolite transporter (DMT)-like permease
VLAGVAFAAQPVVIDLAYRSGAAVPAVLAWRYVLAAVVLGWIARRRLVALPLRVAAAGFGLGLVVYAADSALFYWSLRLVPVPVASLVHYAHLPLVVGGAVLLRHERLARRRAAAALLVLGGVTLVSGGASSLALAGVLIAFAAAVAYAVYVLASGRLLPHTDAVAFAALLMAGTATSFMACAVATGSLPHVGGIAGAAAVVETALVGSVLAVGAFLAGVRRIGASRASLLVTVDVPVGITLSAVLLGQHLALTQLAGAASVLLGIGVLQWRRRPLLRVLRGGKAAPDVRVEPEPLQQAA